jgi:hypothetical protein
LIIGNIQITLAMAWKENKFAFYSYMVAGTSKTISMHNTTPNLMVRR